MHLSSNACRFAAEIAAAMHCGWGDTCSQFLGQLRRSRWHVSLQTTISESALEHVVVIIVWITSSVGQRTRVPFVKSYFVSMATMSFKMLEWWFWNFGGRRLTGACDR